MTHFILIFEGVILRNNQVAYNLSSNPLHNWFLGRVTTLLK